MLGSRCMNGPRPLRLYVIEPSLLLGGGSCEPADRGELSNKYNNSIVASRIRPAARGPWIPGRRRRFPGVSLRFTEEQTEFHLGEESTPGDGRSEQEGKQDWRWKVNLCWRETRPKLWGS